MIVLAIIAVLAGLGVGGMALFRRTVQIEQAKNDLLSALRATQNLARNSISSSVRGTDILTGQVDGYALVFDLTQNTYSLRYCVKTSFVGQVQYDCSGVERASNEFLSNNEVRIQPANAAKCYGLLFTRRDADIAAVRADVSFPDNAGTCRIDLIHSLGNETRSIQIDLASNNISIQ